MVKNKNLSVKNVLSEFKAIIKDVAKKNKCLPKEVTPTLFWNKADGRLSEWQLRKIGGFYPALASNFGFDKNLVVSKHRAKQQSKLDKKDLDQSTARSSVKKFFDDFSSDIFSGRISSVKYPKTKEKTVRALTVVWSDLHFGSDLSNKETGALNYGPKEEARRLAFIVKEICGYKQQHRKETELNLLLLGDIFQGQLHDARDGAPLAEQMARSIHLLSQAVQQLAAHFKVVKVHCASGNHGRNTSRHTERATLQKWDSYETVVYCAVKSALAKQKNVSFNIPKTPYVVYEVFGAKGFATHGDTVLNPGYPGSSINIKVLENQINKINATLPDNEEYKFFIVGHVHTASMTHLNNNATMITNGALVPVDQFSISIGSLESQCGQWIFESVPGYPVGDSRFIRVGKLQDQDASLDKIIQPWIEL